MDKLGKDVEIVVAHYNEDIEWIKPYANNVTIYHKGSEESPRFPVKRRIKLKNVGREGHTYLYHIINNYNSLANITIFLQGGIEDQIKKKVMYANLEKYVGETKRYGFSTRRMRFMWKRNPQIKYRWKFKKMINNGKIKRAEQSFDVFYKNIFGKEQPYFIPYFICGNFGVKKKAIQNRSLCFYEKIIQYFVHNNPEEGHYLERLWFEIFNPRLQFHYFIKILKDPFVFLSTLKKRLKI